MTANTQTQAHENLSHRAESCAEEREKLCPAQDLMEYARMYARENPEVVALWALGIGFVLGWKLKPW
jgi:hypothetical protein